MKSIKALIYVLVLCFIVTTVSVRVNAQETAYPRPETYLLSLAEIEKKYKAQFNDPRPYLNELSLKKMLPKAIYDEIAGDPEQLKKEWAEVVGFRAPDVVGKISPEIKPGKYTYKDVQNNPAFKELMYAELYNRVRPEQPGVIGNFTEFEIIPTRQYYWWKNLIKVTKENMGKTKLLPSGFIDWKTYDAGIPFPRPSGPQKAWQVIYNCEKRYNNWEDMDLVGRVTGFNKNKRINFDGQYQVKYVRLAGRTLFKPYGILDKRAEERGEYKQFALSFPAPRDIAGLTQQGLYYSDPAKPDNLALYIPSMRRVRKLTATDTQDPMVGLDCTYDDNEGLNQKLSPTRYPVKAEIIAEREFLVIAPTIDGAQYTNEKGELKGIKMERRPMYVVQLTELDPSYVYSKRVLYVDKEMLMYLHTEQYDRKGRLYRVYDSTMGWFPDVGSWNWSGGFTLMLDYIDQHSTWEQPYCLPAPYKRADVSLEQFMQSK